ncbi:LytTR family transcriptional regulator DNA-binding domain-containing protein [Flavobacterium haoranii]|uniref:LytTR family transcriptional regulator DNA-binding domain-containing protein n=1 Tax=Flavobacterium haoranii TaxID=683124 RepID=UPI0009FD6908
MKKKYFLVKNLGVYQDALLQHHFFRIHHSYIINVKKIVKIKKKGELYCELSSGVLIPVAKRRQEAFLNYLQ